MRQTLLSVAHNTPLESSTDGLYKCKSDITRRRLADTHPEAIHRVQQKRQEILDWIPSIDKVKKKNKIKSIS